MNEIIADIYHAAAGTKPWNVPLTRITRDLDLIGCQMIGVSTLHGSVLFSHASDEAPSGIELEYVRKYHALDPRVPLAFGGTVGELIFDQDVFEPDVLASHPYYSEFLIPYGGQFSVSCRLAELDGEAVLLACISRYGDAGFTERRRQYIQEIRFHLREAAGIYQKTRRLTTAAMAGTEILHRMARPAMLLGLDRSLNFANEAAKRFMDEGDTLLLAGGRLTALHAASDDRLAIAFQAIGNDVERELALGAQGRAPERRIVRVGRRQGPAEAVLSLTPFAPAQSMNAFGTQPLVLVIVHDYRNQTSPDIMLWAAAFNLTPAQARVALALYQGKTTAQAASELQIAQTTVKSHIKELFNKTETSGQTQLIAVLGALQA